MSFFSSSPVSSTKGTLSLTERVLFSCPLRGMAVMGAKKNSDKGGKVLQSDFYRVTIYFMILIVVIAVIGLLLGGCCLT